MDLPALASTYEGPVTSHLEGKRLRAGKAVYPVTLRVEGPAPDVALRGVVQLEGRPESFASRVARQVIGILIREAGA